MRQIKNKTQAALELLPLINSCERTQKLSTIIKKIRKCSNCYKCYSHNDYTIPFVVE